MASRSAKPSSTRVSPESSTAVRFDPTTRRESVMSVTCAVGPVEPTHALRDRARAGAVGLDQERADGVAAGGLGDVVGVGDQERVGRGGREFLGHADVVEVHGLQRLRAPVLQPQPQPIARLELEVLHGLGGDEDTVGAPGELVHQACRGASVEPRVLQLTGRADRARPHAVEVLQVGADVREAMLQRLDAADALDLGESVGIRGPDDRARRLGDGDVGTIGEARVDFGLLLVRGVEDRGGAGEGRR